MNGSNKWTSGAFFGVSGRYFCPLLLLMHRLKQLFLTLALILCGLQQASAQNMYTISGYITDSSSGEALIGASMYVQEIQKGVPANVYGFYSITLPEGTYTLQVRYLGYRDIVRSLALKADTKLNFDMVDAATVIREAEVVGRKGKGNTESTDMGRVDIDVSKLQTLPALFGEVDLLKVVQLLPGVKTNGEGNSGFYVRGGGPDQNLILLDDATVYNASHLFGFFSVFNADAVKNLELYKGGIPAQYGGRVSSVLDITMKEGNDQKLHGQGGIGLISSRLTQEGPIVKNRGSFMVSGRRTYIDVITKPILENNPNTAGTGYYFYDLNAKANYRISDKDRVYLSGYFGRDVFDFATANPGDPKFKIPYGNATVAARWNHVFGPKLFMNASDIFSE